MDLSMVTESGDVPVPRGARWAALTAAGSAHVEDATDDSPRSVVNVSGKTSIRIEVGDAEEDGAEEGMVLIEWIFDYDDTGAH